MLPRCAAAPRTTIDRIDRSDYDQRMSVPSVLTEAASSRSRPAKSEKQKRMKPSSVLKTLEQHILLDGFKIVIDLEKSRGSYLYDAATGHRLIDLYGFFGSMPVGFNHPYFERDDVKRDLLRAAKRDGDAEMRNTVEVVHGPIDGIDNPISIRVRSLC